MHRLLLACCVLASRIEVGRSYNYNGAIDDDAFAYDSSPPPAAADRSSSTSGHSCVFSPSPNVHFDLTPMKQGGHDFTQATNGGYTYRFNVCGDTVKVCNQQPAPAAKWRGTKCNNLGESDRMLVSLLDTKNPAKGLKITYDQGDICKKQTPSGGTEMSSRFVTYEVACKYGEKGKLKKINELSMCEYNVQFESEHACPLAPPTSIIKQVMTLLVISFGLYCCIGAGYNYHYHKKTGLEAIPNKEMWDEVPGLVRDGVQFSYTHGKAGAIKSYEFLKDKYEQHKANQAGGGGGMPPATPA